MLISLSVVAINLAVMIIWAGLLVFLIGIGFATGFLALVYTAPVAGHATWHAKQKGRPLVGAGLCCCLVG